MDLLGRIRSDIAFEANVWKSYLFRFLMEFQLWWPIWVIYLQKERGLSLTQITLLDTPFFLLIVLSEVPTGAVADRFGRRISLTIAALLFSVAVFVFGIAETYPIILVSYAAWGLSITFRSGADTALLYDSLKAVGREDDFERVNGRIWAIAAGASLAAIFIGAPLAELTNLSFPIVLSAFIALPAAAVALSMHEPRHENGHQEPYFQTIGHGLRDAWRQPSLRYIIIFAGILNTATFAPQIFIQPFLDEHGVGTAGLGLWQAPVRLAGIFAALWAHRYLAGLGERGAFLAMPVALGIAMFALAGIDARWVFVAFVASGVVAGLQNPVLAGYVNRRIPSERRATMLSVQSLVASIIIAGAEPAAGALADTVGLRGMFLAFAALTAVTAPAVFWLWTRAEDDERESARRRAIEPVPATAGAPE